MPHPSWLHWLLTGTLTALWLVVTSAHAEESRQWDALIAATGSAELSVTVERVNRTINAIPARSDFDNWSQTDYWATPSELLQRGAGDCEDFAIAKYYLLRAHGVRPDELRLMIARVYDAPRRRIERHLVLVLQTAGAAEPMVLDNLRDDIIGLRERQDLVPVAGFDTEHYWSYANGRWRRDRDAGALPDWRSLTQRWARQQAQARPTLADVR